MSVEMAIITKRPFPIGILETLNWQTDKDFALKILVRGSEPWTPEELKNVLHFPVEVYQQKLYYSTGTRYATCLALNELLTHIKSKYVFFIEDNNVINPRSVEVFRSYAQEDMILQGHHHQSTQQWTPAADYPDFKEELEGKPRSGGYPIQITPRITDPQILKARFPPGVPWISNGITWYPMEAMRRVNGFDCAYDGQWGEIEYDLTSRLLRAGYRVGYVHSIAVHRFWHTPHYEEKDDPPINSGVYVYNRETGAKNHSIKLCGGSTQYHEWSNEQGIIEAPFGLKQVEALLG